MPNVMAFKSFSRRGSRMIINAPNTVLTAPPNGSPNAPIIGYHNVVAIGNITSSQTDVDGFPVTNLANSATHLKWRSASTAAQYLTVSELDGDIDYVGVAAHNFGSSRAILSIEGYTETDGSDNPIWFEVIPEFRVTDDKPLVCRLARPTSLISVRVRIQPNGTAPEAAVLHVGLMLRMERNIYVGHTPITLGRRTRITNGRSESGNFLGRIKTGSTAQTSITLQNLSPAWYRRYFDPFVVAAEEGAFFFAWRPGDYPREVGYCWLTDDPIPVNQRANGMMNVNLVMGGLVR
jgi:hypothetical protein